MGGEASSEYARRRQYDANVQQRLIFCANSSGSSVVLPRVGCFFHMVWN
nr:unnamed protein product [Callosobruchus analis]